MAAVKKSADKRAERLPDGKFARGGPGGPGRPAGVTNKHTAELRDMIRTALDGAGGVAYLQRQADENPTAFLSLLGRIIPKDINHGGDISITVTTGMDAPGEPGVN